MFIHKLLEHAANNNSNSSSIRYFVENIHKWWTLLWSCNLVSVRTRILTCLDIPKIAYNQQVLPSPTCMSQPTPKHSFLAQLDILVGTENIGKMLLVADHLINFGFRDRHDIASIRAQKKRRKVYFCLTTFFFILICLYT